MLVSRLFFISTLFLALVFSPLTNAAEYFQGTLEEGFHINGSSGYQITIPSVENNFIKLQLVVHPNSNNIFLTEETFKSYLKQRVWVYGEIVKLNLDDDYRSALGLLITDIGLQKTTKPSVRVGN